MQLCLVLLSKDELLLQCPSETLRPSWEALPNFPVTFCQKMRTTTFIWYSGLKEMPPSPCTGNLFWWSSSCHSGNLRWFFVSYEPHISAELSWYDVKTFWLCFLAWMFVENHWIKPVTGQNLLPWGNAPLLEHRVCLIVFSSRISHCRYVTCKKKSLLEKFPSSERMKS